MENKIKVINKFILESIIIFLPFTITYLLLGNCLSGATDFGRHYEIPWNPHIRYVSIEFDTFSQNIRDYSFEVSRVFWGGLISTILLVLIGRFLARGITRVIEKRIRMKSVIENG